MKVFSFIIFCIVVIIFYYNYSQDSGIHRSYKPNATIDIKEPISSTAPVSTAIVRDVVTNASFDEIISAFKKCSSTTPTVDDYAGFYNKQVGDLSEMQLEILYSSLDDKTEYCDKWESKFDSLSIQQINDIEVEKQNSQQRFNDFIALSKNEQLDVAISSLKGKDSRISKTSAISYVLKNDLDFARELADKVGTENVGMVVNNHRDILDVYKCQNDNSSCNSLSSKMIALCLFKEEFCGMDYFSFLDKTRTSNEVNDLFQLSNALRDLLNSDYYDINS